MDVSLRFDDDVAIIGFDDGKKNTITIDAMNDLHAALDETAGRANAIVLAGRPGSFCAGFDRSIMLGDDPSKIEQIGTLGGAYAKNKLGTRREGLAIMAKDLGLD